MYKNNIAKFLFFALIFFFQFALADGTRQVSPGNGNGTATANGTAYYVSPAGGAVGVTGSFPGSSLESKLRVTISDHNVENIFAGFMARTYGGGGNSAAITDAYIRISTAAGVQVFQANIPATGTGAITSYSQAWNGPNIGGSNAAGYTPFTYDPTTNGDYIIELYRGTNSGNTVSTTDAATFPYFDITVASGTGVGASSKPGRLWCRDWGFVTTNLLNANFPNLIDSSFDGDFFVYTNDGFKAKVDFQTGFKPFAFRLIMNFEGIGNTSNFVNDSRSRNGNYNAADGTITYPTIPNGYRVFLTTPDNVAFPDGDVGSPAITGNIYGCPNAYFIPYYLDRTGDVAILLDFNGIAGYQAGSTDVVLEAFNVPIGNGVMPWNGLNGQGQVVTTNASASVSVTLLRGRVNLPVLDGELNTNGLIATAVYPALGNRQLFWDDTLNTPFGVANPVTNTGNNANSTTGGVKTSNLLIGILGPSHAWDGSNPTTATPAPLTAGQGSNSAALYDDYGNGRIINTWFYGSQANSVPKTLSVPSCDNDGDGISDSTDLDDDNDGILDTLEYGYLTNPLGDNDADGVPNYIDPQAAGFVDSNFDGVDDRYDLDLDGVINQFDTDSDGDGCADAIEGSESVRATQIYSLTLASTDANYRYRGQINVLANGTTAGTPSQVISNVATANGVPLLVNPAVSNTGNVLGVADNTDGTSDIGQGLGLSQNAARSGCLDTDGDGIPNEDDLDDDNDGIFDAAEGLCTTSSIASTDGFDSPAVAIVNGNNIQATNPYNGWTAANTAGTLLGADAFNIIKVNGTAYTPGPDFAQSGDQYLDINGNNAVIYKEFVFTTPTVVNASAWFSNRDATSAGYTAHTERIEIFNVTTNAIAVQGNPISFTQSMGSEGWYQSSISNFSLPAGTYRLRMPVNDFAHVDTISYCFSTDTDGDGTPNYLDLDSDNDGCADVIEGGANFTNGASYITANRLNTTVNASGVPAVPTATPTITGYTQAAGQTVESAQNAALNSCFVYAQNDINGITLGQTATGNVLFNDNALDGTALTVVSATYTNSTGATTALPLGTATQVYSGTTLAGQIILNANGTYIFVAAAGYSGTVPITYTASNTSGSTSTATLNIKVVAPGSGGNNAPVAQNDTSATIAGSPVTSNALANDKDFDGNTLTITASSVTLGVATQVAGVDVNGAAVTNAGTMNLAANGTYTFNPAAGFTGTVNPVTYTVSDGNGGTATATITVKVLPNNGANVIFANDDYNVSKGVAMTGNILTNDTDPQSGQTRTITSATANGTTITIGTATLISGAGTITLSSAGVYTFTPLAGYVGTVNIPYTVCDNGTPQACDNATLYLTSLRSYCYKTPPSTGGTVLPVRHGITALNRAGSTASEWPIVRNGAWTVLEAKTKGFVVNRLNITQINAITSPVEGMMVYDTTNNCMKVYTSNNGGTTFGWFCMTTQACPD